MKGATRALAALLLFGLLTLWVTERWAWSAFQTGILLLALWRLGSRPRRQCPAVLIPLLLAAAWPLAQVAAGTSIVPSRSWIAALDWVTFAAAFAVAYDLLSDAEQRREFLAALSLAGALLAVMAVAQKYTGGGRIFWLFDSGYPDNVLGPFVNRNQFAAWVELLLPIALYQAITDRKRRILYGTSAAILIASVVASASRAGAVLVLLEIAAVAIVSRRVIKPQALGGFVTIAAAAILIAGGPELANRISRTSPDPLRAEALRASVAMVAEHPMAGTGLGTWATAYPAYASYDSGLVLNEAHNDWLQFAAEGGIPFLVLFAIFAVLACRAGIRSIHGLGVAAFLLHALVDYPMQERPALAVWFFVIAASTMAAARLAEGVPAAFADGDAKGDGLARQRG